MKRLLVILAAGLLMGFATPPTRPPTPTPVVAAATPTATPRPPALAGPVLADPKAYGMTPEGLNLIVEYEGFATPPEAPDDRYSGISLALGYDCAENSPFLIEQDWQKLPNQQNKQLAGAHPYRGRVAQAHVGEYKNIHVPRSLGYEVFTKIDAARSASLCRKIFPGFDALRPKARDALLSLVYNRGSSMAGPNRREMREMVPQVKAKDYEGLADSMRRMKRVWTNTSIERGLHRRREAEAKLIETL